MFTYELLNEIPHTNLATIYFRILGNFNKTCCYSRWNYKKTKTKKCYLLYLHRAKEKLQQYKANKVNNILKSSVFLIECAVLCLVTQSCSTVHTPWTVDHQAPLSMGILQARIIEWVAMPSSKQSSLPRDQT